MRSRRSGKLFPLRPGLLTAKSTPPASELELQSQLNQPGRHCGQNLVEGRRADVTVRQAEVGVVEKIEELGSELKLLALSHRDVLECREVPISVTRSLGDVASGVAELLHGRVRVRSNALEGIRIEPGAGGARTAVWILPGNKIRAVRRKAGNLWGATLLGNIHGIEYRKR